MARRGVSAAAGHGGGVARRSRDPGYVALYWTEQVRTRTDRRTVTALLQLHRLSTVAQQPVRRAAARAQAHNWANLQKPAKHLIGKFVKMTDRTCACNSLTNFEYEGHTMTGNGNYVNLLKVSWKNLWNHFGWTYFRRVLVFWNHCEALSSVS